MCQLAEWTDTCGEEIRNKYLAEWNHLSNPVITSIFCLHFVHSCAAYSDPAVFLADLGTEACRFKVGHAPK